MPVSVLVADDHQIVRQGLRLVLTHAGFDVVAEAADGRQAVQLADELKPDAAVIDFVMPHLNGLDAALQIRRYSPSTATVLLTMHTEDQFVLEALRAGIRGYVVKTQAADDLVRALREVGRGAIYLSPAVSRTVVDAYLTRTDPPGSPLTPREREVLQLVAEGHTTKAVAHVLGLTAKTVETYRTNIMRKLNIHETAGLVRYAIRHRLITP
jgi:DNA-binding NarL/FixJ family response regulator